MISICYISLLMEINPDELVVAVQEEIANSKDIMLNCHKVDTYYANGMYHATLSFNTIAP